jgi:hypothetical protein
MKKGLLNTSIKSIDSVAHLHLTLESMDCAEIIATLTKQNAYLQRMLEVAHSEARNNNKKLTALRHFNSHAVRGTLTRIWGLSFVMKQTQDVEEVQTMAELLHQEASTLDATIRSVDEKFGND